ncbi:hypothetical protein EXIGLDRAFT_637719 [Exidia glandulosa HHB12029]|uniref:Rrp15p-domain-containing protein n=1 Tax=Exidia glandulosa HHB12029 TaxID=1314781 RepID=A0A165PCF0_EXIGL|nr:hypothetical protein EXIGLDRAFT_637719 [Exidia glandulosa HHB12029]
MHPPTKRQKLDSDAPLSDERDHDEAEASDYASDDDDNASDSDSPDTEDEIALAQNKKSTKTSKRKRRAVSPTRFGNQLQILLGTQVPQEQPLALNPSAARQRAQDKADVKNRKAVDVARKEKEDRGRLTDIIGGWGGESERALRKIAQRGVVKLFNAIQQAQDATAVASGGKVSRPDPGAKDKRKGKDNLLGRGKEMAAASMDKDSFLNLIKSGGVVSKT